MITTYHNVEHKDRPEGQRPVFDRAPAVAVALKAVPAGSEDTYWYGWSYCPATSFETFQRYHAVDFNDNDAAFMRNEYVGTMFVTYTQDAGGNMVPLMISNFADNESGRTRDVHNAGVVTVIWGRIRHGGAAPNRRWRQRFFWDHRKAPEQRRFSPSREIMHHANKETRNKGPFRKTP
jgi:hypothetical protein